MSALTGGHGSTLVDLDLLKVTPGLIYIKADTGSPVLTVTFYGDHGQQKLYSSGNDTGTLNPTASYQSLPAMWEDATGLDWSDSKFEVVGVKISVATNDIDVRIGAEVTADSFTVSESDVIVFGRVPDWAAPSDTWSSFDNVTVNTEVEVTEPNASATDVVHITDLEIKAQTGAVAATTVQILDGSGGSAVWQMEFDEKYGISQSRQNPIILSAGKNPYIKLDNASNNIDVNLGGYKKRI